MVQSIFSGQSLNQISFLLELFLKSSFPLKNWNSSGLMNNISSARMDILLFLWNLRLVITIGSLLLILPSSSYMCSLWWVQLCNLLIKLLVLKYPERFLPLYPIISIIKNMSVLNLLNYKCNLLNFQKNLDIPSKIH